MKLKGLGLPPIGHNDHGVPRRKAFSVVSLVLHFLTYKKKLVRNAHFIAAVKAF